MPLTIRPLLPEPDKLVDLGLRLALTALVAAVVLQVLYLAIGRLERWVIEAGRGEHHARQRAKTLGQMLRNLSAVVVWVGAIIYGLALLSFDVGPLLAGAGIAGVALGFGAQTLVRDLIAGFFILAEDQFSVGDVVAVAGVEASVEEVTLRHTRLRAFDGAVHFVPNGEMKVVTNKSRGWSRIVVDVLVPRDQDLGAALAACRAAVDRLNAEPLWRERLLEPVDLWGIESFTALEAQVRMVLRAVPGPDGPETARELRRRLHAALAEANVRMRSREPMQTPEPGGPRPPAVPS